MAELKSLMTLSFWPYTFVAPDGVYRPTVSDPANMQIFTTDEFRDVCPLVATLRDATPCLRGPRHVVWPRLCEAMAHWLSLYEAITDERRR